MTQGIFRWESKWLIVLNCIFFLTLTFSCLDLCLVSQGALLQTVSASTPTNRSKLSCSSSCCENLTVFSCSNLHSDGGSNERESGHSWVKVSPLSPSGSSSGGNSACREQRTVKYRSPPSNPAAPQISQIVSDEFCAASTVRRQRSSPPL